MSDLARHLVEFQMRTGVHRIDLVGCIGGSPNRSERLTDRKQRGPEHKDKQNAHRHNNVFDDLIPKDIRDNLLRVAQCRHIDQKPLIADQECPPADQC